MKDRIAEALSRIPDPDETTAARAQAALDAIGPVQLKGVLVTTGGYNGP